MYYHIVCYVDYSLQVGYKYGLQENIYTIFNINTYI